MSAAQHTLDPARINVSSHLVYAGSLRYLCSVGLITVALACILALQFIARYKRLRCSRNQALGLIVPKEAFTHYLGQENWEKSRGVSNPIMTDKPADQPASYTQLENESCLKPGVDGDIPGRTMDGTAGLSGDGHANTHTFLRHHQLLRPPPSPPLVRPEMASDMAIFQDRHLSSALSTAGDLGLNFLDQVSPSMPMVFSESPIVHHAKQEDRAIIPRRRSYTKILPIGPPQPVSWLQEDGTVVAFSPSSFPSSNPALPIAPHDSFHNHGLEVKGEIVSAFDDSGAGWKRHTRVYGGGVCLACLASPDREGGFYGDRVRPEEMR